MACHRRSWSIDTDGFLTIVGRTKEVINRGGEKISPYEIEAALLGIRPSAKPPPLRSLILASAKTVAAAVVLHAGATVSPPELRNFMRPHLAVFKVPQRIEIMDSLPKGHTGKVLRKELADALSRRQQQVDSPEFPLEAELLAIWRRMLERDDIGVNDNFFEAGGDSLLATNMLLEAENLFGRRLPNSALAQASTVRELAAMRFNVSGDHELLAKIKNGKGIPLFFCHETTMGATLCAEARCIARSYEPVYLIDTIEDGDETSSSLSKMLHVRTYLC